MWEAYRIGVRISIVNDVSKGLKDIGKDFTVLNAQAKNFEKTLLNIQRIMRSGFGGAGMGAGFGAAAGATTGSAWAGDGRARRAGENGGREYGGGMAMLPYGGGGGATTGSTMLVRRPDGILVPAGGGGRGLTGRSGGRGWGAGGPPFLPPGGGGGAAAGAFAGASMHQGMIVAGTGAVGLYMMERATRAAEEYQHQLSLLNLTGAKHAEIVAAIGSAWQTSKSVVTSSATDNLKTIREMQSVFGGLGEATKYLPEMQKISAVLDTLLQGRGGIASKDVGYAAARMLEERGVSMNPTAFFDQAEWLAKVAVATGGKVSPNDMLQFQKMANPYGRNFNNAFEYGVIPTLIQGIGSGSSVGSAITAMMKNTIGGQMTPAAARQWEALGLLKASDYAMAKAGNLAVIKRGAITGSAIMEQNPFEFFQQILLPAMVGHGINDPTSQTNVLQRLYSNFRGARAGGELMTQFQRLSKDANLITQAQGVSGYDNLLKTDPVLARRALEAQWDNLKVTFGMEIIPILVPALHKLAGGLNSLTTWARNNPGTLHSVVMGFTALSGALAFSGSLILLVGGFKALGSALGFGSLATNISSLAGALRALGPAAIAAAGGAAIGNAIYNHLSEEKQQALGLGVATWMSNISRDAKEAMMRNGDLPKDAEFYKNNPSFAPSVPSKPGGKTVVNMHLDGRKIGSVVLQQSASALQRNARSGITGVDSTQTVLPVAAGATAAGSGQ